MRMTWMEYPPEKNMNKNNNKLSKQIRFYKQIRIFLSFVLLFTMSVFQIPISARAEEMQKAEKKIEGSKSTEKNTEENIDGNTNKGTKEDKKERAEESTEGNAKETEQANEGKQEEESRQEGKQEIVRVGWYEDSYNITGKNGERSGYGYEFQQAVSAYTDWTYEYTVADWSELLKKVQAGEIDLMSGVSYTDERAKSMLFSELPMGEEKYILYADLSNTDISSSDLKTLNGKRVGVLEGSIHETFFNTWEKEHNLHLQHVYITGFEDAKEKIANHELDCLVSAEAPQCVEIGLSAIFTVGGSGIYFAINKDRPDLKEELDNAMRELERDKPFFADQLYQKYLSAVSSPTLSAREQEWLSNHGAIKVGYVDHDLGVSAVDYENGEIIGIINDYVAYAKDCLGPQTLDFELVGFHSQEEQFEALKDHKIDMVFHVSQNPYVAEKNQFALSNTVWTFNLAGITSNRVFDENEENSVAVPKDDFVLKAYISYNYPKWEIVECDSMKDAEQAVRKGQVDCFLVNASKVATYTENHLLRSVFLTQQNNTSFAVNRGNTILLSILNKTLKTIPSSMLTGALSMYDSVVGKVTIVDFVKDNLLVVSLTLLSLFLLVLLVVLNFLKKARKATAQALNLNKKLQESQNDLQSALLQAESANSAKTTFLNNMSHDIRTPMNAIVGITNLMEHEEGTSEKMHSYIQKVQISSRHLLGLINDILDMSRIESNEVVLNQEEVSLAEQIGQIDSIIRAQTNENHQTFHIYVNEIKHEYLIGDGVRLRQIFLNLLSNAVKYTPNGGTITFELTEVPCEISGYARFVYTVTDNGYGMTEEFMKHIFEPFTRAENSMINKVQGTGLGMTITKNIVDLMGGEIHVESAVGKGSRFTVTLVLPIDETVSHEVGVDRVLLVSADDRLINNVKAGIAESHVRLGIVSTEEDAKAWLEQEGTDVIMLAGCLKYKSLAETVSTLRAVAETAILVFCVDYAQEDHVQSMLTASGIDGMILRPFFLSNLALAIARTRTSSVTRTKNSTILNGMHFLCAEDNELNAEILSELLHMYGASCTIYPDGEKIVEAFKTLKPGDCDAILMDVQMPIMNGIEATRAIRDSKNPLGKEILIIAMTANAFSEDVQLCLGAGMDAHISKPLDIAVLEKTLRGLAEKKHR